MCATSTLECAKISSERNLIFEEKLLAIRPSKLLLYGKHDPIMEQQAAIIGIPYKVFSDTHTLYKNRSEVFLISYRTLEYQRL